MLNKEYLVTLKGKATEKTLRLGYNTSGLVCKIEMPAYENYSDTELAWLFNWLRSQVSDILLHKNANDTTNLVKFTLKEIERDLSFANFWEQYSYKQGNQKRAIKLWESMTKDEKVLTFIVIKKYKFFLSVHQNQQQLYPETFLSQRRWTNEYKI